jgi:hypothetical protein
VHGVDVLVMAGRKQNVLIVSVLLPIAFDLALCSNMQRRVNVVWVGQTPILQGLAATTTVKPLREHNTQI